MTLLEGRLVYDQLIMFHPDAGTGPEGDGPSTLCPPAACLMVPATASARRRRRRQCQRHRVSVPGTDQYNTRSPVLASTVNCRVQRSPSRCEVNGRRRGGTRPAVAFTAWHRLLQRICEGNLGSCLCRWWLFETLRDIVLASSGVHIAIQTRLCARAIRRLKAHLAIGRP